ncbi:unnamed protein product [Moneuplotes crassus]|uniref:Uncharacterized protein n=1 Tax=Euplotes crassus TaxID=5936 RepID=A0AAD1U411_EUPCR|nr:unnamed protein product [Moneuplotes crassus]
MSSQNNKYKSAGPSPSHNFTCNSRSRNIKDYRSSLSKYLKANPANLRFNNKANFDFWQKSQMETQQPRARKLIMCKNKNGFKKRMLQSIKFASPMSKHITKNDLTEKFTLQPSESSFKDKSKFKILQNKVSEILRLNSPNESSKSKSKKPSHKQLPTVVDPHSPSSTDFDTVFHSFQKITSLVDRISKNSQKPFGGQLKGPKISLQKELEKFRHEESTRSGISMTGFRNKIKNLQEEKKHRDLFNEPDRLL